MSRFLALDEALYRYVLDHSLREHPAQTALREATRSHPYAGMQIAPEQGQFMALLAKLLGARAAWSNADASLQIHGGNGYALEYEISRVLCDARILNIFEGAAEIQAQVIARGLTGGRN